MRGADFRNLPLSLMIGWPLLALVCVGLATIVGALGIGAWWVVSHLQWVW